MQSRPAVSPRPKKFRGTKWEAERLFRRLTSAFSRDRVTRVYYPEHFPPGKCSLVVLVPADDILVGEIDRVRETFGQYPEPPIAIAVDGRTCLRIMFPFPDIGPSEHRKLLEHANKIALRMERIFGLQAVVSPLPNLRIARKMVNALLNS